MENKEKIVCTKSTDKNSIIYERVELEKMSVKVLKALAKERKINLQKKRKKSEIINIMFAFFLQLKNSEMDIEILPMNFDIITDSNNNINISLWFKSKAQLFSRCINSKKFNDLLKLHCRIEKKQKNEVMVEKNGDLFVHPIIALHAASFLSLELYYEILDFYLHAKYNKMEEIYNSKIEILKQKVIIAELGAKFNKVSLWSNFNASFAFYYFVIDNVVKCGAVGLKDQENSDNLDSRLSSHRSTFARFKLINVIKFKDSNTVTLFESWIKQVLAKYSIGTNTLLEQYECPGNNSEEILNDIILTEFKAITSGSASLCPQELIKQYNEIIITKTNV
jgi:hypothetical protein